MSLDRRTFLQLLTTGALSAAFPPSIARALSIPAHCRTGTIDDVEHIVIMMQENRSFDHYYGTLRGVRGFGENRTTTCPTGTLFGTSRTTMVIYCRSIREPRIW